MNNTITLTLDYYAQFKSQRGRASETITIPAVPLENLFDQLKAEHGFTLPRERCRVAVNDDFVAWSDPPSDGDRIVFIAPVCGG